MIRPVKIAACSRQADLLLAMPCSAHSTQLDSVFTCYAAVGKMADTYAILYTTSTLNTFAVHAGLGRVVGNAIAMQGSSTTKNAFTTPHKIWCMHYKTCRQHGQYCYLQLKGGGRCHLAQSVCVQLLVPQKLVSHVLAQLHAP